MSNAVGGKPLDGSTSTTPVAPAKQASLESLTSRYVAEQHGTYLRLLQEAVQNKRNLNIALTGRYGTGKSSVLDEFVDKREKDKTLRVAISTLGPTSETTTLTNRIQKELVKQLLYRAAPHDFPFSRFKRISPLSWKRALAEAVAVVAVVGGILAFLNLLPKVAATGANQPTTIRVLAWVGFALLAVLVLATLRRLIYGRWSVSDVSAAGATVKLTQQTATYFDEYLEEIVYFFDTAPHDVVLFEDLDRFDDPHIFEALRELNTLLNATAKRQRKDVPLRFVYAIKDSLFEELGSDTKKATGDTAAAETIRTNRTKFFDVVIPVVPFISHRNARELLDGLLKEHGVQENINRALIALVAQYGTDMRLLKNICNEYAVFAERLLTPTKIAPGLTATNLFALVAYKNFHLRDFEKIARRESNLDTLYEHHKRLVRHAIDVREKHKRDLLSRAAMPKAVERAATKLGRRLVALGLAAKGASGSAGWSGIRFVVGSDLYEQNSVSSRVFWTQVAETGQITVQATHQGYQPVDVTRLNRDQIAEVFPEVAEPEDWTQFDRRAGQGLLEALNAEIALLRGADFQDLVGKDRFTSSTEDGERTFSQMVEEVMQSELARELVGRGYLDRNFTLYAAQFYGDFTGVDVANFLVQTVQPNKMSIDHSFTGPAAIANLLTEAPPDFLHTVSAYNIAVLDDLLQRDHPGAADIAATVASAFGAEAQEFLKAYLNSGAQRPAFATLLSRRPWLQVFTHLISDDSIPADIRPSLVDAALRGCTSSTKYELGPEVRDYIAEHYLEMEAFTAPQPQTVTNEVVGLIAKADVVISRLAGLDSAMRDTLVGWHLYALTADNLRVALGTAGDVSFDSVRENSPVSDYCLTSQREYLEAVKHDDLTPYVALTETAVVEVLTTVVNSWTTDELRTFISMAALESRLKQLDAAPEECWPDLAAHRLFESTATNVQAYSTSVGTIDGALARLLVEAGRITNDTTPDLAATVAVKVLNAADVIPDPRQRVTLAVSLNLQEDIAPNEVEPVAGSLFALLLENELIEDSAAAFAHFRSAGWPALEAAIVKSKAFPEFMSPELLAGFIGELLGSKVVPRPIGDKIIDELQHYLPHEDAGVLSIAGNYAVAGQRTVTVDQLYRIAASTRDRTLTLRLLATMSPLPPASETVDVLAPLGEPYSNFANRNKVRFDLPVDDDHRTILSHLRKAGVVTNFLRKRNGKFDVKLAT
ncbi:hypothetical protein JNUCC0626_47300 [Lentzea sp. JNUCC 0626]|uniref:YobI family P-loop NTPase n=1 Tax=Lentzea sp. JNUCC 0626 TaxID=3367513 RepID=UPI003749F88C